MLKEYYISHCSYKVFCIQNVTYTTETPLFFVHGLGTSGEVFHEAFSNEWMEDVQIYIMDLLGYGKSDKPNSFCYDLSFQAQGIYSLIEQLGLQKINLVAHSMGGAISVILSHKHPELIDKLILVEGGVIPHLSKISSSIVGYGSEENFEKKYDEFLQRYNKPSVQAAYSFYKSLLKTKPNVLYKSAMSMVEEVNTNLYEKFLELELPKYYIGGTKSYYVLSDEIKNDFKNNGIKLSMIPEATHSVMTSNPEKFYQTIYDIINE